MNPCVVVANSCPDLIVAEDVIKGILEVEVLPEPLLVLPEARGYSWHVDTKYYSAELQVCCLDKKTIGTQEFADAVNAFILPFDSSVRDGLTVAEQWLTFIEEFDPEIKILLCNNCSGEDFPKEVNSTCTSITRLQAQTWCVKNGFELVELTPIDIQEDSDVEDDFPESTGIKRVIQALHAHVWPNLVMKGDGQHSLPLAGLQHALNGLPVANSNAAELKVNGDSIHSSGSSNNSNSFRNKLVAEVKPIPKISVPPPSNVAVVNPIQTFSLDSLGAAGGNEVGGGRIDQSLMDSDDPNTLLDNLLSAAARPSPTRDERLDVMFQAMESMPEATFEELFNNLNDLKSKAENLPPTQRKEYAEKVAIAFWKSVSGGNDSEVEGISSDED